MQIRLIPTTLIRMNVKTFNSVNKLYFLQWHTIFNMRSATISIFHFMIHILWTFIFSVLYLCHVFSIHKTKDDSLLCLLQKREQDVCCSFYFLLWKRECKSRLPMNFLHSPFVSAWLTQKNDENEEKPSRKS